MDALFRVEQLWIALSALQAVGETSGGLSCRVGVTQRNVLDGAGSCCRGQRAKRHESGQRYDYGHQTRQETPPSTHKREPIAFSQLSPDISPSEATLLPPTCQREWS